MSEDIKNTINLRHEFDEDNSITIHKELGTDDQDIILNHKINKDMDLSIDKSNDTTSVTLNVKF